MNGKDLGIGFREHWTVEEEQSLHRLVQSAIYNSFMRRDWDGLIKFYQDSIEEGRHIDLFQSKLDQLNELLAGLERNDRNRPYNGQIQTCHIYEG